jgi:O-antigen ligase
VSGRAATAGEAGSRLVAWDPLVPALLALGGVTALAVLLSGRPAVVAVPVLLAACGWAMWRAPLHRSAAALALLLLAVDVSTNAEGLWHSPLVELGDALRLSLRTLVPAIPVAVTGTEAAIVFLLLVAAWRRARGVVEPGRVGSPPGVLAVGALYVAAIGLAVLNGLVRGGSLDTAVWQTRPLLVTGGLFLVFEAALRGSADLPVIGKLVVLAACVRALMALWIHITVGQTAPHLDYATDHGDSMLFSLAAVILIAHRLERNDRRRLWNALLLLPLLAAGMWANERRTAWFEVMLGLGVFLVVARRPRWRRQAGRLALAAAPVLLLYGAAGWNASAKVFAPVQLVRSVVDARVDSSTWNRQVENWNVAMSLRERPLVGRGFGHEWTEYYEGDDILSIFHRYKAQPHNQILGILLFAGALAFAAIWAPFAVLVLLAIRIYPRARTPEERAAALAVGAAAVILGVQAYSDLGPLFPQYWVLGALAFAVAGKLATATGALR